MGTYLINGYMWSVHQRNTALTSSGIGHLINIVLPGSTFSHMQNMMECTPVESGYSARY
jgi:hypothetical protein